MGSSENQGWYDLIPALHKSIPVAISGICHNHVSVELKGKAERLLATWQTIWIPKVASRPLQTYYQKWANHQKIIILSCHVSIA